MAKVFLSSAFSFLVFKAQVNGKLKLRLFLHVCQNFYSFPVFYRNAEFDRTS